MENRDYKNFAFISYSHRDMAVAKWLQKNLEGFKLPTEIHNDIEANSRYLRPIFRDQSDLNTGILGDELRKNLEESKFLILICSKNSAESSWVSDEAKAFVEMGRLDKIIPVIIPDGNANERELFPKFLRDYFAQNPDKELLGVNIGEVGKEKALVRVVSRMLDVSFDSLWGRHQRQKRLKAASLTVAVVLLAIFTYFFAIPVNFNISIFPQQAQLPKGENVTLTIDGAEYTAPISNPQFSDIRLPGYRRFSKNRITITSNFFNSIDTLVSTGFGMQRNIELDMARDDTFAKFGGHVYDDDMNPLPDVEIDVAGVTASTDSNGEFLLEIPLAMQRETLPMHISKEGYRSWDDDSASPSSNHGIILHK